MYLNRLILVLALTITNLIWAEGGSMGSGGGMAVSCENGSVELLDVYEAKQRYGEHAIAQSKGELFEDYLQLMKFNIELQTPHYSEYSLKILAENNFFAFHKRLNFQQSLSFTNDQGKYLALKDDCSLQQVAIFSDQSDEILINENLYKKMDLISKAALIFHELYYSFERKLGETTSETTRLHVGHILSRSLQTPSFAKKYKANFTCKSDNIDRTYTGADTELFIINTDKGSEYHFTSLDRRPTFIKTFALSKQKFGRFYMNESVDIVSENRTVETIIIKSGFDKSSLNLVFNHDQEEVLLRCQAVLK